METQPAGQDLTIRSGYWRGSGSWASFRAKTTARRSSCGWRGRRGAPGAVSAGGASPELPGERTALRRRRLPLETLVERETVRPASDADALPERLRLAVGGRAAFPAHAGRAAERGRDYGSGVHSTVCRSRRSSDEQRAASRCAGTLAFCRGRWLAACPTAGSSTRRFRSQRLGRSSSRRTLRDTLPATWRRSQVTARPVAAPGTRRCSASRRPGVAPTWNPRADGACVLRRARGSSDGERVLTRPGVRRRATRLARLRRQSRGDARRQQPTLLRRTSPRTVIPAPLSFRGMAGGALLGARGRAW